MEYTLGDFIANLKSHAIGKEQKVDMQSDEALETINECLPKNRCVARYPWPAGSPKRKPVIKSGKKRKDPLAMG